MQAITRREGWGKYCQSGVRRGRGFALAHHAFDGPRRLWNLWLDTDTIIERPLELEYIRTTAEEDFQGVSVRIALREKGRCAGERIRATGDVANHGPREVGQNFDRFEGNLVQDSGLVIVTCQMELESSIGERV